MKKNHPVGTFPVWISMSALGGIVSIHRIISSSVLTMSGIAAAVLVFGSGTATADVTSTLTANGIVRTESANFVPAPETHVPSPQSGCTYWEMSTKSNNGNALQRFHAGFKNLVNYCGGDGA